MSERISDTLPVPLFGRKKIESRIETWASHMGDEMREISITRVSLPVVLLISLFGPILGGIITFTWSAAIKYANVEKLDTRMTSIEKRMDNLTDSVTTNAQENKYLSGKNEQKLNDLSEKLTEIQQQIRNNSR